VLEGWCLICAESYELPTITPEGNCTSCMGSPRDCDCGDICSQCGDDLEIMEEE
jgi:DNA-directed RNA polymerase subunit RPC12/RpoP